MKFRLLDFKTNENVLGGDVDENNAFVGMHAILDKRPQELAVGESTTARFSLCANELSREIKQYKLLRIE